MGDITETADHGLSDTKSVDVIWKETCDKVAKNVVTVKFCLTRSFDAEKAGSYEATGFVVDAERGYILTNRHVAGPGPFWGRCIFENHEEVDVNVIYYDPVHDFGILRYDPKGVKHMSISAIELRPDLAKVSEAVRIIGNDAGEKLSIHAAVISRLDRNAPEYGKSGYNDFNTNYIQAAAGATGGSSGSPVINIYGHAVALQAGGRNNATTDYFLPLDRPRRALECLQKGETITRGTIQCQWKFKPFNECEGLGLSTEWENAFRDAFPDEVGMLVAERVLSQGPSDVKIKVGDILLKVNGSLLAKFKHLDAILDSSVGQTIKLLLQRRGKDIEIEIEVADLHKITPDRIVCIAGASFQDLSYQRARAHGVACKGVFCCDAPGSFTKHTIIQKIDDKDTPDLDTFIEVMKLVPDQARVVVTYIDLDDPDTPRTSIERIDRYWSSKVMQYTKNVGLWDITELSDAPAVAKVPEVRSATFAQLRGLPPAVAEIARSIVKVESSVHRKIDGFNFSTDPSVGFVIDAEQGIVFVSRITIPHGLLDITITIADSIILEGELMFSHPLHNYALIKYNPKLVDAPLQSVKLSSTPVEPGASLHFLGFKNNNIGGPRCCRTTVTDVCNLELDGNPKYPKVKPVNCENVHVETRLANECGSGILVDDDGVVQALWLRSLYYAGRTEYYRYYGLATSTIMPIVSRMRDGEISKLHMLCVELIAITMSQAQDMKVPTEWIRRAEVANPSCHQLFKVSRRTLQSDDNSTALLEGDIVLALNGNIITRLSELKIIDSADFLDVLVVRAGKVVELKVETVLADDFETKRAISFCGAMLQRPHISARLRVGKAPSEVYVASVVYGSPSDHYKLDTEAFITHVNDTPTPDLDSFIGAAMKIDDNTNFTLTTKNLSGIESVIKMRRCDHYFPTKEWTRASPKWTMRTIEA